MRSVRIFAVIVSIAAVSVPLSSEIFPRLKKLKEMRQQRAAGAREPNLAAVTPHPAVACGQPLNVGYRIVTFSNGLRAAVWYPTTAAEAPFAYALGIASGMAPEAAVAHCGGKIPVAIFSHGFGGCGTQSVFFTEQLARSGYIVAAPDHKDAKCKVDQPREGRIFGRAEVPFRKPKEWSDTTYQDRRDDIRTVLNEVGKLPFLEGKADMTRVAGVGHSLGGYTMIGLAGGWDSWKDDRIKTLLLFSPHASPFLVQKRMTYVHVPVMFQGGTRDFIITPELKKRGGVYESTNSPKYFVEFKNHGHFDWTVMVCGDGGTVAACTGSGNAQLVNRFGIRFLDRYLKGEGSKLELAGEPALADFRSKE